MSNQLLSLAITVSLFLGPVLAYASPITESVGVLASPNPWTRSAVHGPESAYINPALMSWQDNHLHVSLDYLAAKLNIDYHSRQPTHDISETIYDARQLDDAGNTGQMPYQPLPTEKLPRRRGHSTPDTNQLYLSFGGTMRLIKDRATLGFYGLVPLSSFQRQSPFYNDEREQYFSNSLHFERFGDRLLTNTFVFALAIQPLTSLSLGVGVSLANDAIATNTIYLPDALDQETTHINSQINVSNRFIPHFSVAWQALKNWRISSTLHLPYSNKVDGQSQLRFWNFPYPEGQDAVIQKFSYEYDYEPLRISAGFEGTVVDNSSIQWKLATSALWARWSHYRNRHGEKPTLKW